MEHISLRGLFDVVVSPFVPEGYAVIVESIKEPNHFYEYHNTRNSVKFWRITNMPKSLPENATIDKNKENNMTETTFDGYTASDVAVDEPASVVNLVAGEKQSFVIDFANVGAFPLIPKGNYLCRVKKMEMKEGAKGAFFNVEYIIAEDGELKNSKIWQIISLNQKSLWVLKTFLKAFNLTDEEISKFSWEKSVTNEVTNPIFFAPEALVNVQIDHQKDTRTGAAEDAMQARVVKVSPAEDVQPTF